MEKSKIFISYRQSDTQSEASRLKENLEEVFGEENVFFDIETLEPGLNFADAIEKTIRQSKIVLVLIGPTWLKVEDDSVDLRLFKEDDWVRKEVALALSLHGSGTIVIPILVQGAKPLSKSQLPENIQSLADFQWAEITIKRWKDDVGTLIRTLKKSLPIQRDGQDKRLPNLPIAPRKPKSWFAKNYLWVLGIFLSLILIGIFAEDSKEEIEIVHNNSGVLIDQESVPFHPQKQQEIRDVNPNGNEIYNGLNLDEPLEKIKNTAFDYSGKWWIFEEEVRMGYLLISQNGNYFDFEYYYFNQKTGYGTGEYDGTYLYSTSFTINGDPNYAFSFGSKNLGQSWLGQTFNNNISSSAELRRR